MSSDYIQANTDGRLHPATEPSVSPLNRGFLYGDAIYEVWRTHDNVVFGFEEHWRRLEESARSLYMSLPLDRKSLLNEIRRTAAAFREKVRGRPELYIRLQITRGAGAIGLDTGLADKPGYVLLVQSLKEVPLEKRENGLRLSLATSLHRMHTRTLNPAWKTGNYLNNILCLREAMARGADEVVMTNLSGEITEAAVSNLFFVRGQTLVTPPLSAGILAGITRRIVLDHAAPAIGLAVSEEAIAVKDLAKFEECFITSTTKEVAPVAAIDELNFNSTKFAAARRLQAAFSEYSRRYVAEHPELRLA